MILSSCRLTVILMLTASLFLSGCLGRLIARPTVTLRDVQITGLNLTGVTLTFRVELQNPNAFGVTVTAFSYSIYLNDRPIAVGEATDQIFIERRNITEVSLPLKTTFREMEKGLASLIGSDAAEYRIEGSLAVRSFFGRLEVPYRRIGTIDLKHPRPLRPPSDPAP